jgi:hypothetical protein
MFHVVKFINVIERLLMERLTIKLIPYSQTEDVFKCIRYPNVQGRTTHIFQMEKFNHKKLNVVEVRERYLFEISNRFTALKP